MRKIGEVIDSKIDDNGIGTMTVCLKPGIVFNPSHFTIHTDITKSHKGMLNGKKIEMIDELEFKHISLDLENDIND